MSNVLSHGVQPSVQRGPQIGVAERCVGAAALGVPGHDDLFDLQVRDGILDHGRGIDVVGVDAVRDVAVHEQLAGLAVADGRLGDAAVGAAYPQDLGRLAFAKLLEGIRISLGRGLGVDAVAGDDAVDGV